MSGCCDTNSPRDLKIEGVPTASTPITEPVPASAPSSAADSSYTVVGMTCGHCVSSVTEEVSAIAGVRDVVVDLASGALRFDSEEPVSRDAVEAAVREAGYQLA